MSIHNNTLRLKGLKTIAEALPDITYGEYDIVPNDAGGETCDVKITTEGVFEDILDQNAHTIDVLNLPNIEHLRDYMFYQSKITIKRIYAPKLKIIGSDAFRSTSNLKLENIPDTVTTIKSRAFEGADLIATELPDSIESVGDYGFRYAPITISKLPANLRTMGTGAFHGSWENTKLTIKEIPKGVTEIPNQCFYHQYGITEMTFHSGIKSISSNAFGACNNLLIIRCPWSEGEVANAPWGATNATIIYNYTEE